MKNIHLRYDENGLSTADLIFRKDAMLRQLRLDPKIVSIVPAYALERENVETFIRDIYANAYGANIQIHYPVLMSVRDGTGKILAATGFRPAASEPLFLEQYLEQPVEKVLSTPRSRIVEIGNLASAGKGASLFLFAALAAYLHHQGYSKAVVTSTDFLEKRFTQMGLSPRRHAPADPSFLLSGTESWGTYYDTNPHVLSGDIASGYARLEERLGAEYHSLRPRLMPRLHFRTERHDAV